MRPLTTPPPVVYPFAPTMNSGSANIMSKDPTYSYPAKEKARVTAWVAANVVSFKEERSLEKRRMLEFTDAVPKTLEGSPKRRTKEGVEEWEEKRGRRREGEEKGEERME